MTSEGKEGDDPAARQAAEEWRRKFGRDGHEGSYAPHDFAADPGAEPGKGERKP